MLSLYVQNLLFLNHRCIPFRQGRPRLLEDELVSVAVMRFLNIVNFDQHFLEHFCFFVVQLRFERIEVSLREGVLVKDRGPC